MNDTCWCCFWEIPEGQENPGEYRGQMSGGGTLVAKFMVCQTCRDLDCDVPNPDGCLRADKNTFEDEVFEVQI